MSRKTEYLPLSGLTPDPRNPKSHSLETIDASVGRFGVIDQIAVDGRTGYIISGHGRTKTLTAMKERGESPPEGVQVTDEGEWLVPVSTGWASRTDSEAAAALIALNRTTEMGGWVDEELLGLLDELSDIEDGLEGVGFTEDEIAALQTQLDEMDTDLDLDDEEDSDSSGRAPSTGEMLALADVTWGEPKHDCHHGEVWRVGKHLLVLAKLHDEHSIWMPLLASLGPDALFSPYPEPYLTTGMVAAERPMLLVQPNRYLAGHLLDKHASVHPDDKIERVEQ